MRIRSLILVIASALLLMAAGVRAFETESEQEVAEQAGFENEARFGVQFAGPFGRSPSKKAHIAGASAEYASRAAKSQTQIATDMQRVRGMRPSRLGALHAQAKAANLAAATAQNGAANKYQSMADTYSNKADNARTNSVRERFDIKAQAAMLKRRAHKQQADFHQRVADSEGMKEQFSALGNQDSGAQYRTAPVAPVAAANPADYLPAPLMDYERISVNAPEPAAPVVYEEPILPAPAQFRARRYQPRAENLRYFRGGQSAAAGDVVVEEVVVPEGQEEPLPAGYEYVTEEVPAPVEVVYEPPAQFAA